MPQSLFSCLTLLALLVCAPTATSSDGLRGADRFWALRAERLAGRLARPERVEQAIRLYRSTADAGSLEARWKLLRALHYLLDFTDAGARRKHAALEEATGLARGAALLLEEERGDERTRARLYFWSAIAWGARAQRVGLLTLVREGVATQMHDHAQRSLSLDPSVDRGGALRLLSRLHAELPRVPFVSGWVDRSLVMPLAERAFARDPEHPGNRLVLALALLEREPARRGEAIALLEGIVGAEAEPDMLAEALSIQMQATERLEAISRETR